MAGNVNGQRVFNIDGSVPANRRVPESHGTAVQFTDHTGLLKDLYEFDINAVIGWKKLPETNYNLVINTGLSGVYKNGKVNWALQYKNNRLKETNDLNILLEWNRDGFVGSSNGHKIQGWTFDKMQYSNVDFFTSDIAAVINRQANEWMAHLAELKQKRFLELIETSAKEMAGIMDENKTNPRTFQAYSKGYKGLNMETGEMDISIIPGVTPGTLGRIIELDHTDPLGMVETIGEVASYIRNIGRYGTPEEGYAFSRGAHSRDLLWLASPMLLEKLVFNKDTGSGMTALITGERVRQIKSGELTDGNVFLEEAMVKMIDLDYRMINLTEKQFYERTTSLVKPAPDKNPAGLNITELKVPTAAQAAQDKRRLVGIMTIGSSEMAPIAQAGKTAPMRISVFPHPDTPGEFTDMNAVYDWDMFAIEELKPFIFLFVLKSGVTLRKLGTATKGIVSAIPKAAPPTPYTVAAGAPANTEEPANTEDGE